jgi:hypothetical protein
MDNLILKRKNWQIFIVYYFLQLAVVFPLNILIHLFAPRPENVLFQLIEFFLSMGLYFSYPILVGLRLNTMLTAHRNFKLTSVKSIIICLIVVATLYVFDLTFDVPLPWYYLFPLTLIPCALIGASWPARPLKSIELRRNAGIWEYIPDAFQFVFWPLGVWWLQPRLNEIDETKVRIEA